MCLAASAAAPTLDMLSLARLVGGAAAGGIIPLAFAIVGDRFAMTERQLALSRVLTAIIAGQLTGSIGSGFVASYFGWRVATGAVTALTLVALIVTVRQLRSSAPSQPAESSRGEFFVAGAAMALLGVTTAWGLKSRSAALVPGLIDPAKT